MQESMAEGKFDTNFHNGLTSWKGLLLALCEKG